MNLRVVLNVVAALTVIIGLTIFSAVPVAYAMNDSSEVVQKLSACAIFTIIAGLLGYFLTKSKHIHLGRREGFGIVTFGWLAAAAFGALPFVVVSDLCWYDAFFETMSGFTTTGASVLDNTLRLNSGETLKLGIADLPKGLLYWRSLTHWLGGMGIVVLSLAIIPFLGIGGQQLYNAEVPGPTSDQLTPRIANSAKILWGVYVLLTVVEVLLLCWKMSIFDAWCHTCGTMATGGFSTQQSSVGAYDSVYIDVVIIIFMFLAGCNFVLHYRALRGKPLFFFKDEEFRFYFLVTAAAVFTITLSLVMAGEDIVGTSGKLFSPGWANSLRFSAFQVVSILTTTGFCTANFDIWTTYATLLLIVLMFIGGCGGSTGGGMKNSRFLLLLKYSVLQIQRCIFPRTIANVRLNNGRVYSDTMHKVLTFFFLFVGLFVAFTLALAICGEMDFVTASSASIASLGNIGPGLGKVGATCTYAWMNPSCKIILTIAMLLGRLEIYTVIVILLPSFWKK